VPEAGSCPGADANGTYLCLSCPGLTRASTRKAGAGSSMDCRVKPGNDSESSECVRAPGSGPTNPADCHDRFEPLRTFEVLVERNKCPAGDHSPPSDMMVDVRHWAAR